MVLQEHHKQFAVRSFSQFMNRKQVVTAFIEEFQNDISKPPPPPKLDSNDTSKQENKLDEIEKEEFIPREIDRCYQHYKDLYGEDVEEHWERDN